MMPIPLSEFAGLLTTIWVAGLWQGALFVLLGALVLRLMSRATAALRHSVLIALFALTVVLPWLSFHHSAGAAHAVSISPWIAFAVAACWIAAVCFRAVLFAIAWIHLRKVRRNAVPLPFDFQALDIKSSRSPIVCTSAAVDSPFIVGFFEPVLLLPEWLLPTLSPDDFQQIALHEFEHLRRSDDWTNLWLQIGLTLFPINPALVWLNRRIGVQRELACDAAVVAATERPVDYAASLARIAERRLRRNTLKFALAAWGRQSELSHRVHALLKQPRQWSPMQRTAAVGSVAGVLLVCVAGLLHMPRFVRIETPATLAVAHAGSSGLSLPARVVPSLSSPVGAPPVRFVPTSYIAHPASHVPNIGKHKVLRTLHRQAPQQVYASTLVQTADASSFRMARVLATVPPQPSGDAPQPKTVTRAVPALFSSTYLAVPVSGGGWLLIQL